MSMTGKARWAGLLIASGVLAGCSAFQSGELDFDVRDRAGTVDTSAGVQQAATARPQPDERGLISYPTYQVAVARRGDTVASVAQRIGVPAAELARFNGLRTDSGLNQNAVLALPATGAGTGGARDITSIAGAALDRAASGAVTASSVQGGQEPVRHQVARGETAFSIARLYGVSPASLAEWNGLGADLTVREGQFLLIPVVLGAPTSVESGLVADVVPPPPSASSALPETIAVEPLPESPNLDQFRTEASAPAPAPEPVQTAPAASEASEPNTLIRPVQGAVLRPFSSSNEGVDLTAAEGTAVRAAAAGTVAAITRDTDQVPILVLRHAGGLLTVYANIKDIQVAKGDAISAGQTIAAVGPGDPSFLHFEVRRGFEAVDPGPLLR